MIRGVGRAAVATLAAAVLALLPALLRARGPAAATLNLGPRARRR